MREGADGPLSLRDMADIAYLSPFHFARVFKEVTGVPPGEFSAALRLEKAKRLLLTTDLSVGEVCLEVGYGSLGTFTSRFARLVGLPPGQMRDLPERLQASLGRVGGEDLRSTPPAPVGGVALSVSGPGLQGTWISVGLFPGPVPQGLPVAGAILTSPGACRLAPVPDGRYHLMAAALPRSGDPLESLLPGAALRVGRAREPVLVRAGQATNAANVEMRPARMTDPPVLLALPALLLRSFAPDAGGTRAR